MRIGMFAFVAVLVPASVSAQAEVKPEMYAFGVNSGFFSTQVYEPYNTEPTGEVLTDNGDPHPGYCKGTGSWPLFKKAVEDSIKLVSGMKNKGFTVDIPPSQWTLPCPSLPAPTEVEAWRAAELIKISRQSENLAQVYGLGVNIGIAEAQASLGESRRQTVYMALQNALTNTKALGLDQTNLNQIILLAGGTTPMTEIYGKIVQLRAAYQAMM